MTTREKMTMGWMAILILGCETTHGCPDSSALNPPGPGLEASVLDSGFSSDQLDGMASEASTANEDPIRDAGGDDAWVSDARADALPPRLMGECPPGATFITRPLRNLANGYGVDFALAPGETRTFCARVTAPTIPDGTHLSVLRFIWNDVADYECNEAQVTVTQSFEPHITRGPSTGASGALRFDRDSGFGEWATTCEDCVLPGVYVIEITGRAIHTPSDPQCHRQTIAWAWS